MFGWIKKLWEKPSDKMVREMKEEAKKKIKEEEQKTEDKDREKNANNSEKDDSVKSGKDKTPLSGWYWLMIAFFVIAPVPFEIWNWEFREAVIGNWNTGSFILAIHIAYIVLSIRVIPIEENDVVTLLGKPLFTMSAGPVFVPAVIGKLIRLPKTIQTMELPGRPEEIWDRKDADGNEIPIPPDQVGKWLLPIRATFEDDDPEVEKDPVPGIKESTGKGSVKTDPLKKRVTVKITPIFRYKIIDPVKFIETFGSKEQAEIHFDDIVTSEAVNLLQVGTLARAMCNMEAIGNAITRKTIAILANRVEDQSRELDPKSWGIQIEPVRLKPFGLSHELNKDIQAIPRARATGEATKIAAEAEKEKRIMEGEGAAAARKALLMAEAYGYREIADELGIDKGEAVIFIDALKNGMASGNHFFFEGDNSLQGLFAKWKSVSETVGGKI